MKKKNFSVIKKKRYLKTIQGTERILRLTVFCSNKHNYVQIINDQSGFTLATSSTLQKITLQNNFFDKKDSAFFIGETIGTLALKKKIGLFFIFDCNNKLYHGRVQKIAEGARKSGLIF